VPKASARMVIVRLAARGIAPRRAFVIAPRIAKAAAKALARIKLPVAAILCLKKVVAATKNKTKISVKLLKARAKKPLFLLF